MARLLQRPGEIPRSNHDRISSGGGEKREIWSTLLSSVASSKRIPQKQLLVLGGSQESQREFIDSLAQDPPAQGRRQERSKIRKIPLANEYALGYTYKDVYDTDGEDTLARLSIYTLPDPSSAYSPLLTPLLTPSTIPNSALAVLLDWSQPWTFVSVLKAWIQLLKASLDTLPAPCQHALEDNNTQWQAQRDKTAPSDSAGTAADAMTAAAALPLGPGEYDEPLGLPLLVVAQNTQAVERLEKERGYREADFDFALQFLRTVLLKHGAGLVYTMPGDRQRDEVVAAMVRTMLRVGEGVPGERMARREKEGGMVRHNVVDRERVIVPPGWDSWGKIRVLREGFDIEGVSRAWGVEVQQAHTEEGKNSLEEGSDKAVEGGAEAVTDGQGASTSTEALYAARISNPKTIDTSAPTIEVHHTPDQEFLAKQLERLEAFVAEDEVARKQRSQTRKTNTSDESSGRPSINEQIGPVQFNMGGIQYDADEALKRIKERTKGATATQGTPERRGTRESTPFTPGSPPSFEAGKDIPVENLEAYFASLMKGGRGGSVQNSPRIGSPRVVQKGTPQQDGSAS